MRFPSRPFERDRGGGAKFGGRTYCQIYCQKRGGEGLPGDQLHFAPVQTRAAQPDR